jgi:hypothetical protein
MKTKVLFLSICYLALSSMSLAQIKVEAIKVAEFGNHSCEEYLQRMDIFISELDKTSESKGYIMVYDGKSPKFVKDKNGKYVLSRYILPQRGEAAARIKTMKRRLRFRVVPYEKFVFVNAGFRQEYTVEFWVVPFGAEAPKSSPTVKLIKYRRGKPHDFCGNDVLY